MGFRSHSVPLDGEPTLGHTALLGGAPGRRKNSLIVSIPHLPYLPTPTASHIMPRTCTQSRVTFLFHGVKDPKVVIGYQKVTCLAGVPYCSRGAERARINLDELRSIFCSEDLPPQIPQLCQSKPHRADFRATTVEPGNVFQFFVRRGLVSNRIIVR